LGVVGAGPFFERRLTMILRDRVPCRISPVGLLSAGLLALLALPSWVRAQEAEKPGPEEKKVEVRVLQVEPSKVEAHKAEVRIELKDDVKVESEVVLADDDDDDDDDKGKDKAKDKQKRVVIRRRSGGDESAADKKPGKEEKDDKDDPKRAEELKKARAALKEAEAEMKKAGDEMKKAVAKLHQRLQEETQAAQKQLRAKGQDLQKARRKVAELEGGSGSNRREVFITRGQPNVMTYRFDGKELKVQPGPDGKLPHGVTVQPLKPGSPLPPGMPSLPGLSGARARVFTQPFPGGGANPDLEKRMGALEKKFDQLLDEIKSLKKSGSRDRD